MLVTTEGLIIREQNIGEADRAVTVLTKDMGVIRAFASGARRLKSKNISSTALLSFSRLTLYRGRDTYRINESEPIEVFFELRRDIERLALAQYFCELAAAVAPEYGDTSEYLRVLLNALHLLTKGEKNTLIIKSAVELRLMALSGYMPDLTGCACGADEPAGLSFSTGEGRLFCGNCAPVGGAYALSAGVLAAMRYIVYGETGRIFSFSLSQEGLKSLAYISEQYVLSQLDRSFKTLEFYNSMLIT